MTAPPEAATAWPGGAVLADAPAAPADDRRQAAAAFVGALRIRPHFHPVVDLFSASLLGFELLSRSATPPLMPREMFSTARRLGALWELERSCLDAALREIASLPDEYRPFFHFLNVSPDIFNDPRFAEQFTAERLQGHGIDPRRIVLEITEEKPFNGFAHFGSLVAHFINQGFRIAMDDFGSGYSGLTNLVASTPHYLKLDMGIVRDVHKHEYKQKLVKTITAFASSVNAGLIAEGVECLDELEVLIRYGVRYAQGFLFGMPEPAPYPLSEEWKRTLRALVEKYDLSAVDLDARVAAMVIRPLTIACNSLRCRELDQLFKKRPDLDHAVLLREGAIAGLVTRQAFYTDTGGAFGYQLFQKKPVEVVCKREPLVVHDRMTVTTMAKLAMDRTPDDLYDPVLVIDERGAFLGSVTVKQLITKSIELEVRSAMGVNPLTNLPGNNSIHRWVDDALTSAEYTVIYIDLDQFKAYNDTYGFLQGDEMLRFTARVLAAWLAGLPEGGRLGHIGGDDFVIVYKGEVRDDRLQTLCRSFDAQKLHLFHQDDVAKGFIATNDRQGNPVRMPLVTMSLAVIDSRRVWEHAHPALFSEVAASLKKKVKRMTAETGASGFLCEQRRHA